MNVPREPTADMRQAARLFRDMYDAMLLEGFTAAEVLRIIGYAIGAQRGD